MTVHEEAVRACKNAQRRMGALAAVNGTLPDPMEVAAQRYILRVLEAVGPVREALQAAYDDEMHSRNHGAYISDGTMEKIRAALALLDGVGGEVEGETV